MAVEVDRFAFAKKIYEVDKGDTTRLKALLDAGKITAEQFDEITGEAAQ